MMSGGRSLYDEDLARWSEEQAAAIRAAAAAGANLPLDWENVAEEIESLGKSLKAELRSRCATVIEHLIKLQIAGATDPRRGWIETIRRERAEIEQLLDDNPSLRTSLADTVAQAHRKGVAFAAASLERYDELTPARRDALGAASHGVDQVLGPWLPISGGAH